MDIIILRSLVTVVGLCCFLTISIWAYSRGARKGFEEAAMLPFQEDDQAQPEADLASRNQGHAS